MKASEILRQARELISVPERWNQRLFAKDKYGSPVPSGSKSAMSWCLVGAFIAVADRNHKKVVSWGTNLTTLMKFNDNRTHAEVLQVFDRAIEQAEKEET